MSDKVINDEHVDRALALVQYRNQAAAFLAPIEADNEGARTQKEIIRELRQHKGKMPYRELCRALDYTSMEIWKWNRIFQGLVGEGLIVDFPEQTTPGKRATRMVGLPKEQSEWARWAFFKEEWERTHGASEARDQRKAKRTL